MVVLQKHQTIPIDFLKNHRGVILYHSTGSGKTLTALYGVYQFPNDIIIIGPKSSRKTFIDNIVKAEMVDSRFTFYTYTKIKQLLENDVTIFQNKSVIVDEAHHLRNENLYNLYIASALATAFRVVLLTATPVVNYLNDLSVLVNIVKASDVLPTDRMLFNQMFYDEENLRIQNQNTLRERISGTISYYRAFQEQEYPRSSTHYVQVEMNHAQVEEYAYYIRKIIYKDDDIVNSIDILNLDYGLLPSKKRNHFLSVTRQLSNTVKNSTDSPKIHAIFEQIKKGPFPAVVYSNYLKNGIYTLAVLLEQHAITYKTITGFVSQDRLTLTVNAYNRGQYQVLLLTSAGSESLHLEGTRQFHVMEPHWNESRIDQAIGRVIRYQSHIGLPEPERHVDIYRWISVFPKRIRNSSADEYLADLSRRKHELWNKYHDLIITSSIERNPE